jgi:hypothetical protein
MRYLLSSSIYIKINSINIRRHSSNSKNTGYVFEQQNDVRLNDLSSKISAIKNVRQPNKKI